MKRLSGTLRVGIVLSILWVIYMANESAVWDYGIDGYFIEGGVLPLVIFWGLVWIVAGFRNKDNKTEDEDEAESND